MDDKRNTLDGKCLTLDIASSPDILRGASRGEGTRDAPLRMSAGEATLDTNCHS